MDAPPAWWTAPEVPENVVIGLRQQLLGQEGVGDFSYVTTIHALGVPAPHSMAWITIAIELIGGFAVLVGAWIPLVSLPLSAILLVAAVTVHLPYGFSSIKLREVTAAGPQFGPPGYEVDLLYIAALATLTLGGPGPLAVDRWLARRADRKQGT